MSAATTGHVHGRTVTLDDDVPDLNGQRVRVLLEPVGDEELELAPDQQKELWQAWVQQGPHGPISDDDDEFIE